MSSMNSVVTFCAILGLSPRNHYVWVTARLGFFGRGTPVLSQRAHQVLITVAVSVGGRGTCRGDVGLSGWKQLSWSGGRRRLLPGSVAEDRAWSVVEFGGYAVEVGLVVGDVDAFREYSRSRPLVFSLVPRSQGEWRWVKY